MRTFKKAISVLLSILLLTNAVGCTKRVGVPPEHYSDTIGGEDFIYVTTTNGDVFQLQEAQFTNAGISGLLRHERGDVKPVGMGGKEDRSAYIEIRLDDIESVEVERINKKRLLVVFGIAAAGLIGAILLVEATGSSGDGGSAGGTPDGKPPF